MGVASGSEVCIGTHTYAEHVVAPLLRPVLKPAVQSKHASARAAGAYVPAGHDSQLCSFLTYVPAGQSRLLGSGIRMTENSVDGFESERAMKGGFGVGFDRLTAT